VRITPPAGRATRDRCEGCGEREDLGRRPPVAGGGDAFVLRTPVALADAHRFP
jgi:hypothetical protein